MKKILRLNQNNQVGLEKRMTSWNVFQSLEPEFFLYKHSKGNENGLTWRNVLSASLVQRPSRNDKCWPIMRYFETMRLHMMTVMMGKGARHAKIGIAFFKLNTPIMSSWKINTPITMLEKQNDKSKKRNSYDFLELTWLLGALTTS